MRHNSNNKFNLKSTYTQFFKKESNFFHTLHTIFYFRTGEKNATVLHFHNNEMFFLLIEIHIIERKVDVIQFVFLKMKWIEFLVGCIDIISTVCKIHVSGAYFNIYIISYISD